MQTTLRTLSPLECQQVQGGGLASVLIILELPHMIIGCVEFLNYVLDRWVNGCDKIQEGDHVAAMACYCLYGE